MNYLIRTAQYSDIPEVEALIGESGRLLSAKDYSEEQVEGALIAAWGGQIGN